MDKPIKYLLEDVLEKDSKESGVFNLKANSANEYGLFRYPK